MVCTVFTMCLLSLARSWGCLPSSRSSSLHQSHPGDSCHCCYRRHAELGRLEPGSSKQAKVFGLGTPFTQGFAARWSSDYLEWWYMGGVSTTWRTPWSSSRVELELRAKQFANLRDLLQSCSFVSSDPSFLLLGFFCLTLATLPPFILCYTIDEWPHRPCPLL